MDKIIPEMVLNQIDGDEIPATSGRLLDKLNPATGEVLCKLARSEAEDIELVVEKAKKAQLSWSDTPPVQRGMILHELAMGMKDRREEIAKIVAAETGKSYKDALGETDGAVSLALFYASEGQRLYGKTTTSGVQNKYASTVRQPIGVAGLIIAANTPIANVAWKIFTEV